ncbi:MAG: SCP2 sterol-binding domain-containing protein [Pigmentiphaga sp.]|nr:SCP2 sterol-binding domain-containing protein [Pigmentiphaga sp.]MDX3906876.1 SCP2 sterol-binding domain-containing protein [Pigmentiphaga sp.]
MSLNPSTAAVRVLDTLLLREPWARERLRPHAGKTACLVAGGVRLSLTITQHGMLEVAAPEAVPDVTLTVDGGRLAELFSDDAARRMGAVRIEGDAALAHVAGDLARDLRWDVEEDLARIVGDIPAARLVATARGVLHGVREGAWRLAENVAEYLTEETQAVAPAHALQAWGADVRRLRDDAERAAKRVEHLRARLARLDASLGAGS